MQKSNSLPTEQLHSVKRKPFLHKNLTWSSEVKYKKNESILLSTHGLSDQFLANLTNKLPLGNSEVIHVKIATYIEKVIDGVLSVRLNFFDAKNKLVGQVDWLSLTEADKTWHTHTIHKIRSEIPEKACSLAILVGFRPTPNCKVDGVAYFDTVEVTTDESSKRKQGKIDAQPTNGPALILIVGLQKSGTSLLARLLCHTSVISNPFGIDPSAEGHHFWGNPPMIKDGYPAGCIYNRSNGENGHEIGIEDATPEVASVLAARLEELNCSTPVILNKNPHNVLRIEWLRALFPRAVIVGVVRRAVPCVFSLTKKFLYRASQEPNWKAEWWGMEVQGWRNLICDDKFIQHALMWRAANQKLLDNKQYLDFLVPYHELCASPDSWVNIITSKALGDDSFQLSETLGSLVCLDHEYLEGASLTSNNDQYKSKRDFEIEKQEKIELPSLTQVQVNIIQSITKTLENQLGIDEK